MNILLKRTKNQKLVTFGLIMVFLAGGVIACQSTSESGTAPVGNEHQSTQQEAQSDVEVKEDDGEQLDDAPILDSADPEVIQQEWQSSPHAEAFVLDADGNNNPCARCHAPINWEPSLEDLPESCFACKFEIDDPNPYIAEAEWVDIPCKVCHEVDKKGNVQPEYSWLEIAALEEYASVETSTELCLKCHDTTNVPEHGSVQVGGAHEGYDCTECHDAHNTVASCGTSDCHEDVIDPDTPIAGHDDDHQNVSCVACHDAAGMDVGPSEELGLWTTFASWSSETETGTETGIVAFTSHDLILDASCERCHFVDNPWGLSDNVSNP